MDCTLSPIKALLLTLMKRARADIEKRLTEANIDITPLQCGVLWHIKKGTTTINDLARSMSMRPPSLVPVVDALEHTGLLKRNADSNDRRKVQLTLTPDGSALLKKIPFDEDHDALNSAFRALSSEEQTQLLALLTKLDEKIA